MHFKRSYLAEFADPVSPDLVLKQRLVALQEAWEHQFGWQLFRPLHDEDAHVIKQIRVPLTDTTAEFDLQVLLLAKLLIDSLDDARLVQEIGGALPDERSIGKFERFLAAKQYPHRDRDIKRFGRFRQRGRPGQHTVGGSASKRSKPSYSLMSGKSQTHFANYSSGLSGCPILEQ